MKDGLTIGQLAEINADLNVQLATLKAERDDLKNKMELINGLMEVAEKANALAKESVEKMEKERDELKGQVISLAVENSELKSYRPQPGGPAMMEALDAFFEREEYPEGGMTDAFEILCCKRVPTPATDAALASIQAQYRAEGINFTASRLCAAYNNGFIDKPLSDVADIVRMILDAKEEITKYPADNGLSGEYAEKSLEEFAAELRKGAGND